MPAIICLVLALQWGGNQYAWSSPRVIATLVVFAVLFVAWIVLQWFQGEEATVPWSVASQRSVFGASVYTLLGAGAFGIVIQYLPLW